MFASLPGTQVGMVLLTTKLGLGFTTNVIDFVFVQATALVAVTV